MNSESQPAFRELLSKAPAARTDSSVTIIGALSQASDLNSFVLTLAGGRSFTLPTNAVKRHAELSGTFGLPLVQLELDPQLLPADASSAFAAEQASPFTQAFAERVSTGIEVRGDVLQLNPELPREMERLDMRISYRGHSLDLRLMGDSLTGPRA